MAVLKKIKASTLMETMVATVLIVVIFMVSSLVMNSLMASQVEANLSPIKEHVAQLEYRYLSQQLTLPYYEEWQGWEITVTSKEGISASYIAIQAVDQTSTKKVQSVIMRND